jgi:hypothetical protein
LIELSLAIAILAGVLIFFVIGDQSLAAFCICMWLGLVLGIVGSRADMHLGIRKRIREIREGKHRIS